MRNAAELFEREPEQRAHTTLAPGSSELVGMVDDRYPESFYDLLSSSPSITDSECSSAGSCHPSRKCKLLHLLGNGVAAEEEEWDGPAPIH